MRLRSTSSKVTAVALAVAVGFGAATVARAGHDKDHICASPCVWKPDGRMIHTHSRTKGFYSSVNQSASIETESENARAEWARDTIMSLPHRAHANATIHQMDRDYGRRKWSALAVAKNYNSSTGHYEHGHVKYNLYYMRSSAYDGTHGLSTPYGRRALACMEIGHLIGLAHARGDCMGYSYVQNHSKRVSSETATFINARYKRTGH